MNYKSFLDTINAIGPIGDAAMDLSPQKKKLKTKSLTQPCMNSPSISPRDSKTLLKIFNKSEINPENFEKKNGE